MCYAIVVLVYVQTIPDIGLKTIFGTTIRASIPLDEYNPGPIHPEKGDEIVEIAGMPVDYWPDVLNAPFALRAGRALWRRSSRRTARRSISRRWNSSVMASSSSIDVP